MIFDAVNNNNGNTGSPFWIGARQHCASCQILKSICNLFDLDQMILKSTPYQHFVNNCTVEVKLILPKIFEICEVLLNGLIIRRLISPPGKKENPTMPEVAKFRA